MLKAINDFRGIFTFALKTVHFGNKTYGWERLAKLESEGYIKRIRYHVKGENNTVQKGSMYYITPATCNIVGMNYQKPKFQKKDLARQYIISKFYEMYPDNIAVGKWPMTFSIGNKNIFIINSGITINSGFKKLEKLINYTIKKGTNILVAPSYHSVKNFRKNKFRFVIWQNLEQVVSDLDLTINDPFNRQKAFALKVQETFFPGFEVKNDGPYNRIRKNLILDSITGSTYIHSALKYHDGPIYIITLNKEHAAQLPVADDHNIVIYSEQDESFYRVQKTKTGLSFTTFTNSNLTKT